jgi:hypothetical protein
MAVKTQNPKMGRPVGNKHKVPKGFWNDWSNTAKRVFNKTYERMLRSQWVFMHPKATPMPKEHWKTVAWNASVIAADAAAGLTTRIVK